MVWLLNLAGWCVHMSTSWKVFRSDKIFVVVAQKGKDKCFEHMRTSILLWNRNINSFAGMTYIHYIKKLCLFF